MTTSNQPERESDEALEPGRDAAESRNDPERLTSGAWISLAMSLAFFLTMVAIGVKYDVAHHPRSKPVESGRPAFASPLANASTPALTPAAAVTATSNPSMDDPDTLLARAHRCESAGQWDCVIEATSGVIAQRGNTPETKALLAQAMIKGGWVPGNAPKPAINGDTRSVREVSTLPPEPKRPNRHVRRHTVRSSLRYTAANHSASSGDFSDIYRH